MRKTFRTLTINDSIFTVDNTSRNPEVKKQEIGSIVNKLAVYDNGSTDKNATCYVLQLRNSIISITVRQDDMDTSAITANAKGYYLNKEECILAFIETCKSRIGRIAEIMVDDKQWDFF
jgi:hypothetical protein